MEKLGSYLKKEREARNCSLEDISSVTKIRKGILQAIENDDYTLLPPPVFVKGFLRAYATYLGLDTGEVMKRYEELIERWSEKEEEGKDEKRGRLLLKKLLILLTAGSIVLLLVLYLFVLKPSPTRKREGKSFSPPVTVVQEKKGVEIPSAMSTPGTSLPSEILTQGETGTPIAEGSEAKRLNLEFKAREETWMRFRLDDEKPSQILLQAGDTHVVQADRIIRLKIGNAGGVDLSLNGKLLPSLGKSGEVVTLKLTENDL